jgi:hypothetical protein
LLFLFALTVSCVGVDIKDAEVCADAGSEGAMCFHTLSDEARDISKIQWDEERFGMICTKAENFAEWKALILKLCRDSKGKCNNEVKSRVTSFSSRVENTRSRILGLKKVPFRRNEMSE